jgi:hypothetical protein
VRVSTARNRIQMLNLGADRDVWWSSGGTAVVLEKARVILPFSRAHGTPEPSHSALDQQRLLESGATQVLVPGGVFIFTMA